MHDVLHKDDGPRKKMTDKIKAWNAAIAEAIEEHDADIYIYSGPIDDAGFGGITKAFADGKERDNALLILVTNGGLANPAYQIARFFQSQYENFTVYCPSRCKSAGTLVALGAHQLLMDSFSELGPLDVQLAKQNEIFARKSGLLSRSSLNALAGNAFELYEQLMIGITLKSGGNVSFKLASELSAEMTSSMMAPIYSQVNAETIGSEFRDLNIAYGYGVRLAETSCNSDAESVYHLVHNYPSHDFIIDVKEASDLFKSVNEPSEKLYGLTPFIGGIAYDEATPSVVRALKPVILDEDEDEAEEHDNDDTVGEAQEGPAAPATAMDDGGRTDRPVDPETAGEGRTRGTSGESAAGDEPEIGHRGARVSQLRPKGSS